MSNIKRPHWYDFKIVTNEDLKSEQDFNAIDNARIQDGIAGSGVKVETPTERVIFDSSRLSTVQASWANLTTFDGRGILEEKYICSNREKGNQISVLLTNSRTTNFLPTIVTILGTDFEDNLQYEHVTCPTNDYRMTFAHFKTVENILFQNFLGNTDTSVDGHGSFELGGQVIVSEASSCMPAVDLIVANQSKKPDIIFENYKFYNTLETLNQVLTDAVRSEYNIGDLDIDTDVTEYLEFSQGATSEITYAQKFRANTNNIQNVEILVSLLSGSTWTGALTVGIRKLQTAETFAGSTRYLPDNAIDFDPEMESLAEITLDQAALTNLGVELNSTFKSVPICFSETPVASPTLSGIIPGEWYALTVRRTGSTTTGSLAIPNMNIYTGNTGYIRSLGEDFFRSGGRLSIRSAGVWSDVSTNSTWYKIYGDSCKIAAGTVIDVGVIADNIRTDINTETGLEEQRCARGVGFYDSSTGSENYILAQNQIELIDLEAHPNTGDPTASRERLVPTFTALPQSDIESLLVSQPNLVILGRAVDRNPRGNPTVTGTMNNPGLAINNTVDLINPPAELINNNVVGSIIVPNTLKPGLRYRITKKEVFTDIYGDLDSDGLVTSGDTVVMSRLDGYSTVLTGGAYSVPVHVSALRAGDISMVQLIKANLDLNTLVNSSDATALSNFILNGTAYPNGLSEFTRVRLTVEPLLNQMSYLDQQGNSSLQIDVIDTDLLETFSGPLNWEVIPVRLWRPENVEILDLRKITISAVQEPPDLSSNPESGGTNSLYVSGNIYLGGTLLTVDGSGNKLDYERVVVELELPDGTTEKELNIFENFVVGQMKFSDGTFVSSSALINKQVSFEVQISSYAKNMGFAIDGYVDYSGPGDAADEAVGTYIDQDTGLLRIKAYHIVNNLVAPEIRTKIYVICNIKKAGWVNSFRVVSSTELALLLT